MKVDDLLSDFELRHARVTDSATTPTPVVAALTDARLRDIAAAALTLPDSRLDLQSFERGSQVRLRTLHGCLGIVVNGYLALREHESGSRPHIIEWWGPGSLMGLTPTLAAAPSRSFTGLGPGVVALLTSHGIRQYLASHPTLSLVAFELVHEELRHAQQGRLVAAAASSKTRVASLLLKFVEPLATADEADVGFPFTQHDVADALGLSLAQTHRALAQLREGHVAHVARQRLLVRSVRALRNMVHMAGF